MAKKLRIRQVRSTIGRQRAQGLTIRALGIRRLQGVVEHTDSPQIRGMIRRVQHLVQVEEVEE